jgi:hypothetical protein
VATAARPEEFLGLSFVYLVDRGPGAAGSGRPLATRVSLVPSRRQLAGRR